jgi:hypothetical protein
VARLQPTQGEKIGMTTYQETDVRTASAQEDMKVRYTAKTHTSGGRRGSDSRSGDGRLGEFVFQAELKVTNHFYEENMHVAQ